MKKVNLFEAKAHLSEYIDAALKGEEVIICRRNRPVVQLQAVAAVRTSPRPLGGAKGLEIPASFFDPLPDDVVGPFYEDGSAHGVSSAGTSRAAERPGRRHHPAVPRARGRGRRS